ncbi:MAG: helix-turn-helix domain-containing protein [Reyranella sp.]|uniref:helix-turn-helix domain-containing protein n=1 Tax=Reyranella sp. TaxID=1929291 RepID=UPI003D1027A8
MKLDTYLAEEGLTETRFAALVGISQPHVNRLRAGKAWPARDLVERIRAVTGGKVTADDFLTSPAQPEAAA